MTSTTHRPQAFVFDCDGTLLDSMGVWLTIQPRLLATYGVTATSDDFAEFEHLSVEDECAAYRVKWNLDATGEEIYQRLMDMLRDEYATTIVARTGAHAFLEEAARAGIPMAIATSTPAFLVEAGLRHNNMDGFFSSITTTGEAGASKQRPDVYNLALSKICAAYDLGDVAHEDVWVFEDAPFGLRSTREAGYHRLGIFDPAGRAERDEVRALSDIFIDEYPELSLDAICSFAG